MLNASSQLVPFTLKIHSECCANPWDSIHVSIWEKPTENVWKAQPFKRERGKPFVQLKVGKLDWLLPVKSVGNNTGQLSAVINLPLAKASHTLKEMLSTSNKTEAVAAFTLRPPLFPNHNSIYFCEN